MPTRPQPGWVPSHWQRPAPHRRVRRASSTRALWDFHQRARPGSFPYRPRARPQALAEQTTRWRSAGSFDAARRAGSPSTGWGVEGRLAAPMALPCRSMAVRPGALATRPYRPADSARASATEPVAGGGRFPHVVSAATIACLVSHLGAVLCLRALTQGPLDGRLAECQDGQNGNYRGRNREKLRHRSFSLNIDQA